MNLLEAKRKMRKAGYVLTEAQAQSKEELEVLLKDELRKIRSYCHDSNITLSEPYWKYASKTELSNGVSSKIQYKIDTGKKVYNIELGTVYIKPSGKTTYMIPEFQIESKFENRNGKLGFSAVLNNGSYSDGSGCGGGFNPGKYGKYVTWDEAEGLLNENIGVIEDFIDLFEELDNGKGYRG